MKPTELFKLILAAISFLGELASVMRSNNVPLRKEGRISSGKATVNQGAIAWECDRTTQARLMLAAQGKPVNLQSVEAMANFIALADSRAKAGYAIEKAFAPLRLDALYATAKSVEVVKAEKPAKPAKEVKGAKAPTTPATEAAPKAA